MAVVTFSDKDLKRGTVLSPGWYRVRIDNVGEVPAKASDKGPSTNYPVEGTVLFNADNGSKVMNKKQDDGSLVEVNLEGLPLDWNFNSKAIGFAVGFLECFGVKVEKGMRFDLNASAGKEIDVFVENGEWQGRIVNRVNHKYRTPKAA